MKRKYFSGLEKIYLNPTVYFLSFLSNQTYLKKVLFLIFFPKLFIHPVSHLNKYTLKVLFFTKYLKLYISFFIFYVWCDKQILIKMIGFISATLINPFDSWQLPISPIRCCLSYSFITLDSINATRCKKLRTGCSITFAYLSIPGHHWIYLLLLLVGNCHHHHWPPFSTLTIAYLLLLLSWVTCYC